MNNVERSQRHHSAQKDLDTRADTICVGTNVVMIFNTSQACDVKRFHCNFESIKDVPVATVATVYGDENGGVYNLTAHEALFFGKQMGHSLINPNIIRHYGIPVLGCTIFFEMFAPSEDEINHNPHIVLTDEEISLGPSGIELLCNQPYGDNVA